MPNDNKDLINKVFEQNKLQIFFLQGERSAFLSNFFIRNYTQMKHP